MLGKQGLELTLQAVRLDYSRFLYGVGETESRMCPEQTKWIWLYVFLSSQVQESLGFFFF